ncbi:MAG: hypothetical protein AAF485_14745 [Chloroflexota bacterium]
MSVSIYYTAKRSIPLSPEEQTTIQHIVKAHDVAAELETYLQTGEGYN